ncbi:MAG: hypothetical protein JST92_20880, partial [Deltaproteobacteria bacterium]|nr:hypothetical protein [Deltaproteobacteria bacterium]
SLIWSEGREALFLDGREVRDPRKLELERISVDADAPDDAEVEVQAKARLQVVTAQSLGDVARWLGRGRDSNSGLSGNVISAVADDLTRSVETVCLVRPREPGAQAVTFDAAPAPAQKLAPASGTSTSPQAAKPNSASPSAAHPGAATSTPR